MSVQEERREILLGMLATCVSVQSEIGQILLQTMRYVEALFSSMRSEQRICEIRERFLQRLWASRWQFEAERRAERRRRRRRRMLLVSQLAVITNRSLWRLNRSQGAAFWSNVLTKFDDDEWRRHFRMTRGTFNLVLELIEPHLQPHRPDAQHPLVPGIRLAVAIWWYATPCEYRSISAIFGIGVSTVCMVVRQVTGALKDILGKRFISLPSGTRLQETIDGFAERGYPMCAGAIDGSHIPIITPSVNPAAYYNYKGWHSVVLQAVVDHNFCFSDVFVGWPGHMHDAHVLANSPLYRKAEEQGGYLFARDVSKNVDGVEVPAHLVGDAAYPLRTWLMKGFTQHQVLDSDQQKFNKALNSAKIVVEHAFGHLKGRWRCLSKRLNIATAFVPDVVFACCVLHNICELNKENFLPEWALVQADPPAPSTQDCNDPQPHGVQIIRSAIMSIL